MTCTEMYDRSIETVVDGAFTHSFNAMATDCRVLIDASGIDEAQSAATAVEREIRRIEQKYSRFEPESELSRINQVAEVGGETEVDDETSALIRFSKILFTQSGGHFDITTGLLRRSWNFDGRILPEVAETEALRLRVGFEKIVLDGNRLGFTQAGMEIDLGGVGKEYAVDRSAAILDALQIRHALIDLGGDLRAMGARRDGTPWRIGIRDPAEPERAMATYDLTAGALATSGDYLRNIEVDGRKYGHILDPRTGWPAQGLTSATVVAPTCMVAGGLASSTLAMGRAGGDWLASLNLPFLLVDEEFEVRQSGFNLVVDGHRPVELSM